MSLQYNCPVLCRAMLNIIHNYVVIKLIVFISVMTYAAQIGLAPVKCHCGWIGCLLCWEKVYKIEELVIFKDIFIALKSSDVPIRNFNNIPIIILNMYQ